MFIEIFTTISKAHCNSSQIFSQDFILFSNIYIFNNFYFGSLHSFSFQQSNWLIATTTTTTPQNNNKQQSLGGKSPLPPTPLAIMQISHTQIRATSWTNWKPQKVYIFMSKVFSRIVSRIQSHINTTMFHSHIIITPAPNTNPTGPTTSSSQAPVPIFQCSCHMIPGPYCKERQIFQNVAAPTVSYKS